MGELYTTMEGAGKDYPSEFKPLSIHPKIMEEPHLKCLHSKCELLKGDSFWVVMKVFWAGSGIVLLLNSHQRGDYLANHF